MPTYRIYYAEREPEDEEVLPSRRGSIVRRPKDRYRETEWEELIDGPSPVEALDRFFRDHNVRSGQVRWVDDDGDAHPLAGLDYDPGATYVWMEKGKMMEFQGIDEATPGMVTCPLCDGSGEVDEEVADEFIEEYGSDDEEDEGE